jgi:hypothetical protein
MKNIDVITDDLLNSGKCSFAHQCSSSFPFYWFLCYSTIKKLFVHLNTISK